MAKADDTRRFGLHIETGGEPRGPILATIRTSLIHLTYRMIVKPYKQKIENHEPRQRAGAAAERQMAHYLHRRFKDDPEAVVLHGLRLEDRDQLEQDGSPGVCQVDHLIVHRWGMFIVESKSVTEEIRVRPDGSGGDEWSRVYQGKETGMPSPIRQARRQSEFLRAFLQRNREELVGRQPFGRRTIARIKLGTDQRGFMQAPIQLVIGVSDDGTIRRLDGWKEPWEPFRVFVTKADLVPDKIAQELKRHRKGASLLSIQPTGEYGLWSMEAQEAVKVAEYLAAQHVDRSDAPPFRPNRENLGQRRKSHGENAAGPRPTAKAVCKHCGAKDLTARWGKFGYHWRCGACGKNTAMPVVCTACGAQGRRGKGVRVRKDGSRYFRDCEACGTSETVWTDD